MVVKCWRKRSQNNHLIIFMKLPANPFFERCVRVRACKFHYMNSRMLRFSLTIDRRCSRDWRSAQTVTQATTDFQDAYIKWPHPPVLSPEPAPFSLLPSPPGRGSGQHSTTRRPRGGIDLETHLRPLLDSPSSSPSNTCATRQASCLVV